MAHHLPDTLICVGVAVAVVGVGLFSVPASLIVFGIISLAAGVLLAMRPKKHGA